MLKKLLLASILFAFAGCVSKGPVQTSNDANKAAAKAPSAPVQPAAIPLSQDPGFINQVFYPQAKPVGRWLAGTEAPAEKEYLAYYQYNPETKEQKVDVFAPAQWRAMSAGQRFQLFDQMYFANTRAKSHSGIEHQACFTGDPERLLTQFFSNINLANKIDRVSNLAPSISTDRLMIGMQYKTSKQSRHFRLIACRGSGKGTFFSTELLQQKIAEIEQQAQAPEAAAPPALPPMQKLVPAQTVGEANEGFRINDKADFPTVFTLKRDYQKAPVSDTPWRKTDLDLSREDDALKFALMLQKYAYEGMANQDPSNIDGNFIAKNNKKRYWCHMPWLNQGANGREAIHGLTQERDLAPSKDIWPNPPKGGDWGVGYFNGTACQAIGKVFANSRTPEWTAGTFDDGSVIFKILFSTADFDSIHNAYAWHANVNQPGQAQRSVQTVRHIQMDIGVKDNRLRGLATDAHGPVGSGWLMLTYYYDALYDSPLAKDKDLPNLPEGLRHMRPMGIATGFTSKETIIFAGSHTNQVDPGMLNGPADNPKSSCMGCHGTAGTSVNMVPGIISTDQWREVMNGALDFGQQFALAKRNFETRPQAAAASK
jgi:hypothetical protein